MLLLDVNIGDAMTRLRTPEDLSDLVGVPVQTLYAWRTRGKGPKALKIGRHLRYRESDIEAWLRDNES